MNIPPRLPNVAPSQRPNATRPADAIPAAATPSSQEAGAAGQAPGPSDMPDRLEAILEKVMARVEHRIGLGDLSAEQASGLGKAASAFEEALHSLAQSGATGDIGPNEIASGTQDLLKRLHNAAKGILGGSDTEGLQLPDDIASAEIDRFA